MNFRILRKIAPAIVFFCLAFLYGFYLKNHFKAYDAEILQEWNGLQTALVTRAELVQNLVVTASQFATNENLTAATSQDSTDSNSEHDNEDVFQSETNDARRYNELLLELSTKAELVKSTTSASAAANAERDLAKAFADFLTATYHNEKLRSDKEYQSLITRLADEQTALTDAREKYNNLVMKANTPILSFPGKFLAPAFHLTPHEYFNASEMEDPKTTP